MFKHAAFAFWHTLKDFSFDDINSSIYHVANNLLTFRFFYEASYALVTVSFDNTESTRVFHRRQGYGYFGSSVFMEMQHLGKVQVSEDIAVHSKKSIVYIWLSVLDSTRGAQLFCFDAVNELCAQLTFIGEIFGNTVGLVAYG